MDFRLASIAVMKVPNSRRAEYFLGVKASSLRKKSFRSRPSAEPRDVIALLVMVISMEMWAIKSMCSLSSVEASP